MSESRPSQNQLEGIIGTLAHARLRPGMYIGSSDIAVVRSFFYGFEMALHLVGVVIKQEEILVERGWLVDSGGLTAVMKEQGFSDQQITTELFSVLIIALTRQFNLSTEPIRQTHAKVRETAEKGLQADRLDPETRTRFEYELEIMSGLEQDLGVI